MSDTPSTDAACLSVSERVRFAKQEGVLYELVPAKFARNLERDRAELLSVLRALLEDYDATMKTLNECRMADGWDELAEEECAIRARKTIDKMEKSE
jgi:hypothetical protein